MAEGSLGRGGTEWWGATADIGWIVGHSYIVYAPLLAGCTTVAYEGGLDHPDPETFYRIIERNRISGIFTSPTAVRVLMKYGSEPARKYDLSSLTRAVCGGGGLYAPGGERLPHGGVPDRVPGLGPLSENGTRGPI